MFHAQIFKLGFDFDCFVCNDFISAFGCSGFPKSACKMFDESPQRDIVAWTALINGFVKNDVPGEAQVICGYEIEGCCD